METQVTRASESGRALRSHAVDAEPDPGRARLPTDVLTATLALTLWVTSGSVILAILDGLGPDPARRLAIGLLFVSVSALALWQREALSAAFVRRPWLVVPIAVGQLAAAVADGLVGGPYVACSLTSIGLAVVVARARTVWICVVVLIVGYCAALLVEHSLDELIDERQLGSVVGALVSFPVAAALLLGLRRRFTRFLDRVELTLEIIRHGAPAFTPVLSSALGRPTALPPAPITLTPAERRVVESLVSGNTPKQIAHELSVSIATVRTHIKHAKRKLGASTLAELAAIAARSGRSAEADDER